MANNALLEKLLDLPEFNVIDLKMNDHDVMVYVEAKDKPFFCPHCGTFDGKLRGHGSRKQVVRDLNMQDRRCVLEFKRRS